MINMTFSQAASLCGGRLCNTDGEISFSGVETDSRKIKDGMLFAPVVGARVDGHSFAANVKENGAGGMLWQSDHEEMPDDLPLIIVDDVIKALGVLARAWLEMVSPYTIGVTGSNGKTSTKDFCACLMSFIKKTWKTQGNRNSEIGLPLTIFEMPADTEALILEMGMENKGEIAYLCSIAPLDCAIITSIGSAHMENLGSKENIARAKCEILTSLKPFGTFIYNTASEEMKAVIKEQRLQSTWQVIPYGAGTEYAPHDLKLTRHGLSFEVDALSDKPFVVHAAADVQADNATAALLAARAAGVPEHFWHDALEGTELTPMRGQILKFSRACIYDDTYKSNPEAASSALHALMEIPASVHVAVLGDMLDLGPEENELHASIGRLADELGVDRLYTYGPLSVHTSSAFKGETKHFENKEELINTVRKLAEVDAAILIKGSRAMKMDEVVRACLEGEAMKKIRLGIIFGGQSSEYSVSLHSAASFIRSLNPERYEPVFIGISKDGGFYRCLGDASCIEHDEWIAESVPAAWVRKGIYDLKNSETFELDCVFPILHGKNGEDGAIEGLLQMLDLPCAGCDILGSAICMDKEVMHRLCDLAEIPTAQYICINERDERPTFDEVKEQVELPWIIKPCNAGSSYGVAFVDSPEAYNDVCDNAFKYDGRGKILVEHAIDGFEIGCAVMGDEEVVTGEIDEIEIAGKVFDFAGKYAMQESAIYCPARISASKAQEAKDLAKKVFRTLCCRDMARVDMFIDTEGHVLLNEVNTIPGFTETSRYPTMMAQSGRSFTQLIDELVDLAMEKERRV